MNARIPWRLSLLLLAALLWAGCPPPPPPQDDDDNGDDDDDDNSDDDTGDDDTGDDDTGDDDTGDDDTGDDDTGDDDTGDDDTAPGDADGDGYEEPDDCDDGDPGVHPGAAEIDDGVDQDCDGIADEDFVSFGDVVISEIMPNPLAVADGEGEWFEIYNASGGFVDLMGWVVSDAGADSHVISPGTSLLVGPGDYLVLGALGNQLLNGGAVVDYEYGGAVSLSNSDDEIYLDCAGLTVDAVEYDGGPDFPDPDGASMSLDPGSLDAGANDDGSHWCEASSSYGDGDLGTPGAANDDCGGGGGVPVGGVIVTEVMQNPAAVSDNDGEWFELHNTTGSSLDLEGCQLSDDDGLDHTIAGPLVVWGGGYVVLGTEADTWLNGGVSLDYEYGGGLNLTNGDDELILSCGGLQIDRIAWDDGATFPDPTGASMSLAPAYLTHTANDDGSHWCEASSSYGDGDLGTPGGANDGC